MSEKLYREGMVDSLVSSEELDQAPRALELRAKILLWLFALAVVGCAAFSYYVSVPVSIQAEGIVWTPRGLRNITVSSQGLATRVMVVPGQNVSRGEMVALIDQSDLRIQLNNLELKLKDTRAYIEALEKLAAAERTGRMDYHTAIDKILANSAARYRAKEERLKKRESDLEKMLNSGTVRRDDVDQLIDKLGDTRERMSSLVREQASTTRDDTQADIEINRQLLTQRRQAEDIREQIAGIDAQLLENDKLLSPFDGRVTDVEIDPGDFISPGTRIATIQPTVTRPTLLAVVYPGYEDGSRLHAGMAAELELSAYPKEKFGVLKGKVTSVSELPVSSESMMRTLKNDLLVHKLSGDESPFEVLIELEPDTGDPSGYAWSADTDEARMLRDGMQCDARLIVRTKKLYELFLPQPF